jgi:hypothetical protein
VKPVTNSFSVPTSRTVLLSTPDHVGPDHQPIDEPEHAALVEGRRIQAPIWRYRRQAVEGRQSPGTWRPRLPDRSRLPPRQRP